jgi:nicotinate-nucleotide adenylyltransferase
VATAPRSDAGPAGRLGILGGSFDPPHVGHLAAAREVAEVLELERVLLVPAARSPHKLGEGDAPAPDALRLRMLEAAVAGDPLLGVSDLELRRGGVSYTVDTVRELADRAPESRLFLLLGADQWERFSDWRKPHEIARRATLVVMTRAGEGAAAAAGAHGSSLPGEVLEVSVPRIDLSSSDIRARVSGGRSIRYLVPDEVRRIIEDAKLYS